MNRHRLGRIFLVITIGLFTSFHQSLALGQSITAAGEKSAENDHSVLQVGLWGRRSCCNTECTICAPATSSLPSTDDPDFDSPSDTTLDLASAFDAPSSSETLAPNMIGDSPSTPGARVSARSKIADNASPMPQQRMFGSYHHFGDIFLSGTDLDRGFFGIEHAFSDGLFSIEIRNSIHSFQNTNRSDFGHLITSLKVVLYRTATSLISGGLATQWAVGSQAAGIPSDNHIASPFVGYIFTGDSGRGFVHGFNQLDIPFDSDDQPLLHTSTGVGYWIYQNPFTRISGIAPTIELHLYTPVGANPSGAFAGFDQQDALNMTTGLTIELNQTATIAAAFNVPLTAKDYDYEAQIQFNWFYGPNGR